MGLAYKLRKIWEHCAAFFKHRTGSQVAHLTSVKWGVSDPLAVPYLLSGTIRIEEQVADAESSGEEDGGYGNGRHERGSRRLRRVGIPAKGIINRWVLQQRRY